MKKICRGNRPGSERIVELYAPDDGIQNYNMYHQSCLLVAQDPKKA